MTRVLIQRDWPKAAQRGLPKSAGPIDHLICEASRIAIERLCARVPDLLKIADHIRALATTPHG